MPKFIDLHSHVLWDMDDGAKNFEETKKMIDIAIKNGTEVLALTPHINRDENKVISSTVNKARDAYQKLLNYKKDNKLNIDFKLGFEVYYSSDVLSLSKDDLALVSLAETSYILIELPFEVFSPAILAGLHRLRKKGFTPIIVHPERVEEFIENPHLTAELASNDILFQVNSGTICGYRGKELARFSLNLVKSGIVHLISSDAHNAGPRSPSMIDAYNIIKKEISGKFADLLFYENPTRILGDKVIIEPDEIYMEFLEPYRFFRFNWLTELIIGFKRRF